MLKKIMPKKQTYIIPVENKKPMINFYIGIVVVVGVLFPFVVLPLRYQIGEAFSTIIIGIGNFSLAIGGIFMAFGVVGILTKSRSWAKYVITGTVLLWIGCWCTGAVIEFLGWSLSGPNTTGGGNGYG